MSYFTSHCSPLQTPDSSDFFRYFLRLIKPVGSFGILSKTDHHGRWDQSQSGYHGKGTLKILWCYKPSILLRLQQLLPHECPLLIGDILIGDDAYCDLLKHHLLQWGGGCYDWPFVLWRKCMGVGEHTWVPGNTSKYQLLGGGGWQFYREPRRNDSTI